MNNAIKLSPDLGYLFFYRGGVFHTLKNYELAISDFTKAIQLGEEYAVIYIRRGKAYEGAGDIDRAKLDYVRARNVKAVE